MKSISTELLTHLAHEVTTLARCWKLTRRDGMAMGFTELDRDIICDGITYIASGGVSASSIASSASMAVDNLDIEGILDSSVIAREDILSGVYDFAEVECFLVNYADLTQGKLHLRTGWLGEVTLENGSFTAEIRGLTQRLSQPIGELYSPACRAKLGDARCKIDVADYTVDGIVGTAADKFSFYDSARIELSGSYNFGTVIFTTGLNQGRAMEIKEFTNGTFYLVLPMPHSIAAGDHYQATRGCDKTLATCRDIYGNSFNFRGEPHIPGINRMLETAGTR